MRNQRHTYIPTLDGWRAVAVIATLLCHARDGFVGLGWIDQFHFSYSILTGCGLGVDVFFAISGFLITTIILQEEKRTGAISLSDFYLKRVFRILPAAFTYLAVLALLGSVGWIVLKPNEILTSVFFVRNYLHSMSWYTGHLWSLAVEEHFYLIWPLVLLAFGTKRALPISLFTAVAVGFWRSFDLRYGFTLDALRGVGFSFRTDTRIDGLLYGCFFAALLQSPKWAALAKQKFGPGCWCACVSVFLAVEILGLPFKGTISAFLLPMIVLGSVLNPTTIVAKILEFAPLRWIGKMSYSIYIWQQLWLLSGPGDLSPVFGALQAIPLNFPIILFCAMLSYIWIELPFIALGASLRAKLGKQERAENIIIVLPLAKPFRVYIKARPASGMDPDLDYEREPVISEVAQPGPVFS